MSQTDLNAHIMQSLMKGDLEKVSADGYKLTNKGREEAELLLLHDPDSLDIVFKLTAAHLKMYLSKNQQKILQDTFDTAMRQVRTKHSLMIELYEAIDEKDKQISSFQQHITEDNHVG